MIDESAALLPLWMVLSAASGFLIGDLCGDLHRRRKCLEQANLDLRTRLNQTTPNQPSLQRELRRLRGTLNDLHKHVTPVTKGLPETPFINPAESTPGSTQSGHVKTYGWGAPLQ